MERLRRGDLASSLSVPKLRTFVRVVDLGSMTRAAEALHMVQSAMSTQVAGLASQVGGPLLERRDGRLVPTHLGRIVYEGASDVLGQLAVLDKRLREASAEESHLIAVASSRTVRESSVTTSPRQGVTPSAPPISVFDTRI